MGEAQYVVEFDDRSDGGPRLVGPFPNRDDANTWVLEQGFDDASWNVSPLAAPVSD